MKYISLRLFLILLTFTSTSRILAQTASVVIDFDGYNGTVATVPPYTFISWNSVNPASFYTSAGNFGVNAPSYKFGNDGDYLISKEIIGNDSISFWVKGNGAPFSASNELRIYHSYDSTNWTLQLVMDSLPTTGTGYTFPISHFEGQYKFEYFKTPAGGNLAIDDINLCSNTVIGQSEIPFKVNATIYPSPTTGLLNIRLGGSIMNPKIEVYDNIGNKVNCDALVKNGDGLYSIDLSNQKKGFYFVRIQSGTEYFTQRISLVN